MKFGRVEGEGQNHAVDVGNRRAYQNIAARLNALNHAAFIFEPRNFHEVADADRAPDFFVALEQSAQFAGNQFAADAHEKETVIKFNHAPCHIKKSFPIPHS